MGKDKGVILKVKVHFIIFYLKNLKQFVNDLLSFKLFRIVTFMFLKNYPQNLLKETKKLLIKFYDAIAAILPPNYSSRLKLGKIDCCDVHEKKKNLTRGEENSFKNIYLLTAMTSYYPNF